MNPTRTNILNKNPETDLVSDLIEEGTTEQAQAALRTRANLGRAYLIHTHVGNIHSLAVQVARTPEEAAAGRPAKNIKWRGTTEDCPIPNPTIDAVLAHQEA